jgi:hypothetical protein
MQKCAFLAILGLVIASNTQANPIPFVNQPLNAGWNPPGNNGQPNSNFSGVRDAGFDNLELGLRAQQRFVGPITPVVVNSPWGTLPMYNVQTGQSPPPNSPDLAWWNFDFSVAYDFMNQALINLTIDPVAGNVQDLNDIFIAGNNLIPNPLQNSLNPGFNFLSGPGDYDYNATGIYLITLSLANSDAPNNPRSTSILVNVGGVPVPAVPEPMSVVVFGLLTAAGGTALRRRKMTA